MTWLRKALKSPLGRDHYKTLTTAAIARELTPAAGWRVTASAAALGVIAGVVTVTVAVAGVILGATVDLKDGVVEVVLRAVAALIITLAGGWLLGRRPWRAPLRLALVRYTVMPPGTTSVSFHLSQPEAVRAKDALDQAGFARSVILERPDLDNEVELRTIPKWGPTKAGEADAITAACDVLASEDVKAQPSGSAHSPFP